MKRRRNSKRVVTRSDGPLEILFRAAPLALVGIDMDGVVDVWNPAAESTFGWTKEEALGHPLRVIPVDEYPDFEALREQVLARREVVRVERKRKRKDGTVFDARLSFSPRVQDGSLMGMMAVVEDITELRRASTALRDSEELFRLTFDEAPIGMALLGLDGRFSRVNKALCQILGYSAGELMELSLRSITHPDDPGADSLVAQQIARGETRRYQGERRCIRQDGLVVDVALSCSGLRGRDGQFLYCIAHIEEISDRKRIDRVLRQNEEALNRAQRVAHLGSWERNLRTNEVVRSPEVYAIYGVAPAPRFRGSNALARFIHPDDRDRVKQVVSAAAREGRSFELEHRLVRPDGTERIVRVRGECTREDGAPSRMTGTVLDITDLRRAEREKAESIRWLRQVLAQSPVGMILVPPRREDRAEVNECAQRMIGRPIDRVDQVVEHLGSANGEVIRREDLPCVRALRGERVAWAEYVLRSATGRVIPVAASAAPVLDEAGRVQGAVVTVQDITPMKELERLRAEWSSIVAHDLRQPVAAINFSASALLAETASSMNRAPVLHIIACARQLDRMIHDLLELSQLEAQQLTLSRERVDVPALVRSCVARVAVGAPDRRFEVSSSDDIPVVEADPDRITQVLDNLLTNAIKYGDRGTAVVVRVDTSDVYVVVTVTNSGPGIDPEELPHLFRRFHRTPEARRSAVAGIGLGLYVTRGLIESHGGRVSAESALGGTTTIRFTLPKSPAASLADAAARARRGAEPSGPASTPGHAHPPAGS